MFSIKVNAQAIGIAKWEIATHVIRHETGDLALAEILPLYVS